MIYLKKDGTWGDTHEPYPEQEWEQIGDDIIEEVEEYFVDNCTVITESADDGKWLSVSDAPDLEWEIKHSIEEHTKGMSQEAIDYITEYVNDNISSESDLCEQACDDYRDRLDDGPDYDDWND